MIREAITMAHVSADVRVIHDGEDAVRWFDRTDADAALPCPNLVILDINLPKRDGAEVLRRLRQSSKCGGTMVIVVSSSDADSDREQMANLGAQHYFHKPSDLSRFLKLGDVIRDALAPPTGA